MNSKINFLLSKVKKYNFLELFIIASPFIDLINCLFLNVLKINFTIGMVIRFVFLGVLLYYFIFKCDAKYKKWSLIYFGVIAVYSAIFLTNMIDEKGFNYIFFELKTLIKNFYYPTCLIIILNLFESKKYKFDNKVFVLATIIYLTFILIPILTSTSLITYSNDKKGYIGWFYSPNEIGAILAFLSPFMIALFIKYANKWYTYLLFAIYAEVMFAIGTKVPFLGITLTIFVNIIILLIRFLLAKTKERNYIIKNVFLLVIMSIIGVFLFIESPVYENFNIHIKRLDNKPIPKSEKITNIIYSGRDKYNQMVYGKWKEASLKEQVFGLGLLDVNNEKKIKYNMIEIDYGDIFYIHGIVGMVIYFLPIIYMIINMIIKIFASFKKIIYDDIIIMSCISLTLIMCIALFAGHVFTAPAVSLYPAIIISSAFIKIKNFNNI